MIRFYHAEGYQYNWDCLTYGMIIYRSIREKKSMKGVFNGVSSKSGNTNGRAWTVYNVSIDGKNFGLGYSTQLTQGLVPGDTVEFEVKENPKKPGFFNIDTLTKAVPTANPAPQPASPAQVPSGNKVGVDYTSVDRRVALEIASSLVVARFNHPAAKKVLGFNEYLNKTVALADHFVKYIQTGVVEVLSKEEVEKVETELDPNELVG